MLGFCSTCLTTSFTFTFLSFIPHSSGTVQAQRSNMLVKQKTQPLLGNVFSNCDQLISSNHVTSSQGPKSHPLKCSNDFPLSATLAALNSLSVCNHHMLCTLGNTVRTIYHGKSSSKTNRVR